MSAAHPYTDAPPAAWVHLTDFGTFHICEACHVAGHCPPKRGASGAALLPARQNAASVPRRCQCEHADHMGGE